jgi:hypothetical protein
VVRVGGDIFSDHHIGIGMVGDFWRGVEAIGRDDGAIDIRAELDVAFGLP